MDSCAAPAMHCGGSGSALPNMQQCKNKMEVDETAKLYRRHFLGKVGATSRERPHRWGSRDSLRVLITCFRST